MRNFFAAVVVVIGGVVISLILGIPIVEVVALVMFAAGLSAVIALGDKAVDAIVAVFS